MSSPLSGIPAGSAARIRSLGVIRVALLLGVILFGVVIRVIHSQPSWAPAPALGVSAFRTLLPIVFGLAAVAIVLLSLALGRTPDDGRRARLSIAGWAIGEGAALAGAVYYFATNAPSWYVGGIFVMLGAFLLLPLRRTK